jgi:hypothetical protein
MQRLQGELDALRIVPVDPDRIGQAPVRAANKLIEIGNQIRRA